MITLRDIPHHDEEILQIVNPGVVDGRWTEGSSYWKYVCRYTDRHGNRYEVAHTDPRYARRAVHKKVVLVELQERFWRTEPGSTQEIYYGDLLRKFVRRNRKLLAL